MKDLRTIVLFVLMVMLVPALTSSGVVLNFVMTALYACLLAQAWNILGGFGGQFSFGHALFFGTGAYAQAMLQIDGHLNAWVALPLACLAGATVGAGVGAISFRYGLKGSYFALVTLAFAEVFRILALSVPFTGAGVGLMLPLQSSARAMQFEQFTTAAQACIAGLGVALLPRFLVESELASGALVPAYPHRVVSPSAAAKIGRRHRRTAAARRPQKRTPPGSGDCAAAAIGIRPQDGSPCPGRRGSGRKLRSSRASRRRRRPLRSGNRRRTRPGRRRSSSGRPSPTRSPAASACSASCAGRSSPTRRSRT